MQGTAAVATGWVDAMSWRAATRLQHAVAALPQPTRCNLFGWRRISSSSDMAQRRQQPRQLGALQARCQQQQPCNFSSNSDSGGEYNSSRSRGPWVVWNAVRLNGALQSPSSAPALGALSALAVGGAGGIGTGGKGQHSGGGGGDGGRPHLQGGGDSQYPQKAAEDVSTNETGVEEVILLDVSGVERPHSEPDRCRMHLLTAGITDASSSPYSLPLGSARRRTFHLVHSGF